MGIAFHKMHGLGNDFVVIDARVTPVSLSEAHIRAIADRHTGVGFDQLIIIEPSTDADARMRIFNADGGEVEACGNATRCVTRLLGSDVRIETLGGILHGRTTDDIPGGGATIDLGAPRFDWQTIPLAYAMDTRDMPVGWDGLERPTAVNVGNPHVVFFVPDAQAVPLEILGPRIETDPLFPERVNVNVATITGPDRIDLRVWERGVGLTLACGTGACATAVAAIRLGLATGPVTVTLPGGALEIAWSPGESIMMTGAATHVFSGEIDTGWLG
jgi:diaminopimelate epimerase